MKQICFPKPLKKGDKIAIISPAGSVEMAQLESGIAMIAEHGYQPVLGKNTLNKYTEGYSYAGTEEERADDLNWALNSDEISAVWATRGGYGCQHLVQNLQLQGFRKKPKWYIGYSDNTVLQSVLLKKGFPSIHGQTIKTSSFGVCEAAYSGIFDILNGALPKYLVEGSEFNRSGTTTGRLVGGNLALIYALLGTGYSFEFKGNILFIEDIGEQYYSLDRMLMSLELAGVFEKISGLVVGGMTYMGDEKSNAAYAQSFDHQAYEIISKHIKKYEFPAAFGFSNGHIYDNQPLVIGAKVKLNVNFSSEIIFEPSR